MINKFLFGIIALFFIAIGIVGAQTYAPQEGSYTTQTTTDTPIPVVATVTEPVVTQPTQADTVSPQEKTFTFAEVQAHASESSCYTTINGLVYDLTSFINLHPGGRDAALSLCGSDGTEAFLAQHGGNPKPEKVLVSLKIGVLVQ